MNVTHSARLLCALLVSILVGIVWAEPIPVDKFDPITNVPVSVTTSPAPLPGSGKGTVIVAITVPRRVPHHQPRQRFFLCDCTRHSRTEIRTMGLLENPTVQ